MGKLARDLDVLSNALKKGVVTKAEAAERLEVLAARVPCFVVLVTASKGQSPVLYYLASSDGERKAVAEVERALGLNDLGEYAVHLAVARQGLVRLWLGTSQEETGGRDIGTS